MNEAEEDRMEIVVTVRHLLAVDISGYLSSPGAPLRAPVFLLPLFSTIMLNTYTILAPYFKAPYFKTEKETAATKDFFFLHYTNQDLVWGFNVPDV